MPDALPEAVSAEHLTGVLRAAGALSAGRVASVAVESSRQLPLSNVMRLRPEVDGQAEAQAPRLFFKTRRPDSPVTSDAVGRAEVGFYSRVAPLTPAGLLPRCFEAVDSVAGGWHLLLEDLTESHNVVSEWPVPPTIEQCDRILGAHARFHAFWWDHPQLGASVGAFLSKDSFDRFLAEFPKQFADFADKVGERMTREQRRVYERLMASATRLVDTRYHPHRNLTLIHGDAHVWNALYPKAVGSNDVRLIDWDGWKIDAATDDLAYMMAIHWFPERRRRLERESLRLYHAALTASGVGGYDFDAL